MKELREIYLSIQTTLFPVLEEENIEIFHSHPVTLTRGTKVVLSNQRADFNNLENDENLVFLHENKGKIVLCKE